MIRPNREYREMPLLHLPDEGREKRIDSDYYVEGYATTFEEPYLLLDDGETKFYEQIARGAFDGADTSDVIFLHDHEGKCLARNRMRPGKPSTLLLEPDEHGLFIAADLGTIAEGRDEYDAIMSGLIWQMSFAFSVKEDDVSEPEEGVLLRTITRFRKIYDVSSVVFPANPGTVIDAAARSSFDGFVERKRQEIAKAEARKRQIQRIRILTEVNRRTR